MEEAAEPAAEAAAVEEEKAKKAKGPSVVDRCVLLPRGFPNSCPVSRRSSRRRRSLVRRIPLSSIVLS